MLLLILHSENGDIRRRVKRSSKQNFYLSRPEYIEAEAVHPLTIAHFVKLQF